MRRFTRCNSNAVCIPSGSVILTVHHKTDTILIVFIFEICHVLGLVVCSAVKGVNALRTVLCATAKTEKFVDDLLRDTELPFRGRCGSILRHSVFNVEQGKLLTGFGCIKVVSICNQRAD